MRVLTVGTGESHTKEMTFELGLKDECEELRQNVFVYGEPSTPTSPWKECKASETSGWVKQETRGAG